MNAPRTSDAQPSVFTDEIVGLSAIYTPGVRVVAWRRALPEALSAYAAGLVARRPCLERACTVMPGQALAAPRRWTSPARPLKGARRFWTTFSSSRRSSRT